MLDIQIFENYLYMDFDLEYYRAQIDHISANPMSTAISRELRDCVVTLRTISLKRLCFHVRLAQPNLTHAFPYRLWF